MYCRPNEIRFLQVFPIIGTASLLVAMCVTSPPANAACMPGGPCISVAPYTPRGMGGMGGMGGMAGSIIGSIIGEAIAESINSSSSGSGTQGNSLNNQAVKQNEQGVALMNAGKPASALPYFQQAIKGFQQAASADPGNAQIQKNLTISRSNLAIAQQRLAFQKCNSLNEEGLKLANAGNNAAAAGLFGQALQACPNIAIIKNNLDTARAREEQEAAALRAEQQRQASLVQSAKDIDQAIKNLTGSLNGSTATAAKSDLMDAQPPVTAPKPGTEFFGQPANPTNPNLNDSNGANLRAPQTGTANSGSGSVQRGTEGTESSNTQTPPPQSSTPTGSTAGSSPAQNTNSPPPSAPPANPANPAAAAKPGDLFDPRNLLASNAPRGDWESQNCPFEICSSPKKPPLDQRNSDCIDWDGRKGPRPSSCPPPPTVTLGGMKPNEFTTEQKYKYLHQYVFGTLSESDWAKLQSTSRGKELIDQAWNLMVEQGELNNNPTAPDQAKRLTAIDKNLSEIKKEAQKAVVVVLDDDKGSTEVKP